MCRRLFAGLAAARLVQGKLPWTTPGTARGRPAPRGLLSGTPFEAIYRIPGLIEASLTVLRDPGLIEASLTVLWGLGVLQAAVGSGRSSRLGLGSSQTHPGIARAHFQAASSWPICQL